MRPSASTFVGIEQHPPVIVVGAGGHALGVIDVLWGMGRTVLGCVSTDGRPGSWLPVDMLGRTADVPRLLSKQKAHVVVAVGDNYARQRMHAELTAAGVPLVVAVSPHAAVSPSARIGAGAVIMPGSVVNAQAEVCEGAIVNSGAIVDHECRVGEFAHLAPRSALAGRVVVGRGAYIGLGATVIQNVSVGDWAVVGAGAAVTTTVPAGTTVAGVPARVWTDS